MAHSAVGRPSFSTASTTRSGAGLLGSPSVLVTTTSASRRESMPALARVASRCFSSLEVASAVRIPRSRSVPKISVCAGENPELLLPCDCQEYFLLESAKGVSPRASPASPRRKAPICPHPCRSPGQCENWECHDPTGQRRCARLRHGRIGVYQCSVEIKDHSTHGHAPS